MTEQLPPVKSISNKSFWKRPEGKVGAFFLIAGAGVVAYFHQPIFDFVQSLLKDTISTVALGAVVAAMLYLIFNKKTRNLIWYMYKGVMRWITQLFVDIDPIKILENYIDYLKKNMQKMDVHISKLKGQISQIKTTMVKNEREMEHSLKLAEQAKKQGKTELITLNTRQYGRLNESNKRYEVLLNKMNVIYKVLHKIYTNSGYLIQDTENDVRMRKQELKAIKTSHSAMKRAMNIIQGDPDKRQIFDMATENVVQEIHTKIGEMERFIELSGSFIDSIDLQNGVYEQEGLELLEKLEKDSNSFLFSGSKEEAVKIKVENKDDDNLKENIFEE